MTLERSGRAASWDWLEGAFMVGPRKHRWKLAAAVVVLCAGSALAQSLRPPTPRKSDDPPYIWNIFIMLVIVGAVFGASMIPSKRGHQD